jgi:hypothetical protein
MYRKRRYRHRGRTQVTAARMAPSPAHVSITGAPERCAEPFHLNAFVGMVEERPRRVSPEGRAIQTGQALSRAQSTPASAPSRSPQPVAARLAAVCTDRRMLRVRIARVPSHVARASLHETLSDAQTKLMCGVGCPDRGREGHTTFLTGPPAANRWLRNCTPQLSARQETITPRLGCGDRRLDYPGPVNHCRTHVKAKRRCATSVSAATTALIQRVIWKCLDTRVPGRLRPVQSSWRLKKRRTTQSVWLENTNWSDSAHPHPPPSAL